MPILFTVQHRLYICQDFIKLSSLILSQDRKPRLLTSIQSRIYIGGIAFNRQKGYNKK